MENRVCNGTSNIYMYFLILSCSNILIHQYIKKATSTVSKRLQHVLEDNRWLCFSLNVFFSYFTKSETLTLQFKLCFRETRTLSSNLTTNQRQQKPNHFRPQLLIFSRSQNLILDFRWDIWKSSSYIVGVPWVFLFLQVFDVSNRYFND